MYDNYKFVVRFDFICLTSRFLNVDIVLADLTAVGNLSKYELQKIGKSFWIFPDLILEDTCWSSMLILDYIHLSFEKWIIQKYMTDIGHA